MAPGSRVNSGSTKKGLSAFDDEMHAVAGDVDARHLVDDLVDLGDDDAVLEGGRLDDGRRVLGVRAGVEVAVAVGADRGDQRDVRREVDEVAGEQLEIGVDRAELDLAAEQHAWRCAPTAGRNRHSRAASPRRARTGRDARAARRRTAPCAGRAPWRDRPPASARGQQIGLLLVVAFEADPIARPDDGLQQPAWRRAPRRSCLSPVRAGCDAGVARFPAMLPVRHRRAPATESPNGNGRRCARSWRRLPRPTASPDWPGRDESFSIAS